MALTIARRLFMPVQPGAFRLFLAMLVFGSHFSSFAIGAYAVDSFFVLSGFWLQRMWSGRYSRAQSPYFTYMVSRGWRLAPVMALVSAATIIFLVATGITTADVFRAESGHLLFSTLFLLGYAWLPYLPVGSAWSLDVEMQFYLLAPALSLLGRTWRLRISFLVIAAACSLVFAALSTTPILPKYLFFFAIGMISAHADWTPSRRLALGSALAGSVIAIGVLATPLRGVLIIGAHPGLLTVYNVPCQVVLATLTIPYTIYTTRQRSDPTDRMMADLSYIVYLLHWPAMQWFFTIGGSFKHRLPYAGMSFLVVPPTSWLIWRFFDRPINHARAEWVTSRIGAREGRVAAEVSGP